MHGPRRAREEVGDRLNETTTERILQDTAKDIRQMLADIGLLCSGCNDDIKEELENARSGLSRADTAVRYALFLKKHPQKEGA